MLYTMKEKFGKWGFVNENAEPICKFIYDEVRSFSEGLAAVRVNDKWGYINEDGAEICEIRYDAVGDFQIPNDLNKIYNDRSLRDEMKPSKCWSSMVSPPLYGTNLMCCVLWDRITELSYHYGIMEGEIGELENMMTGANARYIKENCPKNCKDCCSYNDNKFMESLWKILKVQDNVDDIEFFFEY